MDRLIKEWKEKFSTSALERGKTAYENGRVADLKEDGDAFSAAVLGRERRDVSLILKNGNPIRMSCRCPMARGGYPCEHMAALLYAIEGKLYGSKTETAAESERTMSDNPTGADPAQTKNEVKTQPAAKEVETTAEPPKRRPGRPRKDTAKPQSAAEKAATESEPRKRRPERPRKNAEPPQPEKIQPKNTKSENTQLKRTPQEMAEREAKRAAREQRKAERARKEAERKAKAEEARRKELERLQAEEERREEIRQQKKAEEERRREKQLRDQEVSRLAVERRKIQEEEERKAAAARRAKEEEERKAAEERRARDAEELIKERKEAERIFMETQDRRRAAQRAAQDAKQRADGDYTLLGDKWTDDQESPAGNGSIEALEQYTYFDGEAIMKDANLSKDSLRMGEKLYYQGLVGDINVTSGFNAYRLNSEMVGQILWDAKEGLQGFQTVVTFSRTKVTRATCGCPACQKKQGRYAWYYYENEKSDCRYVAALLFALRDFLKDHNIGDATDRRAAFLMNAYQQKRMNLAAAGRTKEESLILKPRLVKKDGALSVSFKIGNEKLFVIKQLDEFCENVRNAATATYGSSTEFNHRRSNFTDESRKWLRFIEQIVQEEEEFGKRLANATRTRYYYQRTAKVGGSLNLFGWRLDEFYDEIGDGGIEYEDRDQPKTKKLQLRCGEGNPRVTMRISEADLAEKKPLKGADGRLLKRNPQTGRLKKGEFHGIQVEGSLPELYFGMNCAYYIEEAPADSAQSARKGAGECRLCRSDQNFQEKIEGLASMADEDGDFSFVIGRNNMSEFYHQFLPDVQDVVEIIETDPDRIHSFVPPQVTFVFYLDASEQDVFCSPYARYEDRELSLMDLADPEVQEHLEQYRDLNTEDAMLTRLQRWLPYPDWKRRELTCGREEELVYRMMTDGVEELLSLGEVQCTTRFRARRRIRPVKVAVGVSVSSGLLNLDISTDDVSQEELLDILNSYRQKKDYYRLKDGSYAEVDEQSMELLAELMDSMHLKPKEFVQGKMHLPMYRTLYLNKMLEENESVYTDRDSRFRELVKEFKTVNDADFDVPKSLSKIMRPYQKDGYKWLRTLETWQFGGILADDMGLGKTLQMIAVLLSAKERHIAQGAGLPAGNTTGTMDHAAVSAVCSATSIVVSPAALVFNWGEEFARFAPELRVLLITGTQEERREKIAACQEYDVVVTSYDLLKRDIDLYEEITFEYEVIDEAQYIKNHTTAAAKAVKVVKSRYCFALTGTPIENRLSELWSIFDYLMPGFLYTYDVFRKEMELPIVKHQDEAAMQRLQKMTGPFILRRLKEDVLKDLPDKLEEVRYVRMEKEQQQLYDGQVVHMRETIAAQDSDEFNKNKLEVLTELMRLRQICCDPTLCFDSYRGDSAKADACIQLIMSAIDGGHRMLVFSQFTSMLEILQRRLDEEQIPYFTITGATAKQRRLELVKEFNQGSTPVFLISLKAGGVGLNLIGADVVIHYDPWWNVAAQNQATDRAHRIGQTKKVTVYKLIAKNTIEEKILKLQQDKRALADQVISGDTASLGSMSRDDLLELLDGKA
ncbi:MAG: SNF2 helicase associated domain-containing protein [Clostridiales bacterium]|nr:SNF2 helicase associated domain-containing protein [Clostridiales bacterium]